jgi:ketosteroid isomerase-like protein
MHFASPRRLLLAALCLTCVVGVALAQDPNVIAAQTAGRQWLAFVDRGDAQTSWGAAGKKFQSANSVAVWADGLKKARARFGTVTRRTAGPTRFQTTLPGSPDGEYVQLLFSTSFANKANGRETLTMEREADGKWRVIGYFPQ